MTHFKLVPRSRKCGSTPSLPNTPSCNELSTGTDLTYVWLIEGLLYIVQEILVAAFYFLY
jgi:hypothetical protein